MSTNSAARWSGSCRPTPTRRSLIGRYIPNLVPRLFTLDRDFVAEIRDLVPAEPLDEILADYDTWITQRPKELGRRVVIELLAWQFASPVRWIETQDLLFTEEAAGGLGIERFVEIGVKSAPTVAGLATQHPASLPELRLQHRARCSTPSATPQCCSPPTRTRPRPNRRLRRPRPRRPKLLRCRRFAAAAPARAHLGAPRPDDIPFDAADATLALIALSAKMRIDQIEPLDSIESITDGASSRRNQLLVDLGSELDLGAIDGAAEADLTALRGQVTKLARTYKPFGPVLSDAVNDQLRSRARTVRQAARRHRRTGHQDLGTRRRLGQARHRRAGAGHPRGQQCSRRCHWAACMTGALADAAAVDAAIDAAVAAVAARRGISVALPSAGSAGGGVVDSAALTEFAETVTGRTACWPPRPAWCSASSAWTPPSVPRPRTATPN